MHKFIIAILILFGSNVMAETSDEIASKMAGLIAKSAPQQMDEATIILGAYSVNSTVVLLAEFDPKKIGASDDDILSMKNKISVEFKKYIVNGACSNLELQKFFRIGGAFIYKYRLPDGTNIYDISIKQSDCK